MATRSRASRNSTVSSMVRCTRGSLVGAFMRGEASTTNTRLARRRSAVTGAAAAGGAAGAALAAGRGGVGGAVAGGGAAGAALGAGRVGLVAAMAVAGLEETRSFFEPRAQVEAVPAQVATIPHTASAAGTGQKRR